jgi:hypothetical protein
MLPYRSGRVDKRHQTQSPRRWRDSTSASNIASPTKQVVLTFDERSLARQHAGRAQGADRRMPEGDLLRDRRARDLASGDHQAGDRGRHDSRHGIPGRTRIWPATPTPRTSSRQRQCGFLNLENKLQEEPHPGYPNGIDRNNNINIPRKSYNFDQVFNDIDLQLNETGSQLNTKLESNFKSSDPLDQAADLACTRFG